MPFGRFRIVLAGLLLAALSLPGIVRAQSNEPAQAGNAHLDVPASASPGDVVSVGAVGFRPGTEVQVFLMGPGPTARLLPAASGSGLVDSAGRARWSVQLPADLVPPGGSTWWLNADDAQGNFANVALDFRLRPAVEPAAAGLSLSQPSPLPLLRSADPRVPGPAAPRTVPPELAWAVVLGTSPLPAGRGAPIFVASESLSLREEPAIDAGLIGAIAPGSELHLLAGPVSTVDADYYHVRLPGGLEGFAAPSPDDVAGARPSTTGTDLSYSAGAYRLRAEPSTDAAIHTLLEPGATVRVLGTRPAGGIVWAHVQAVLPVGGQLEGYLPNEALWPLGAP